MLTTKNINKPAGAMVAYLREEMCGYMPLNYVTMRLEGLFIVEKQWTALNIQKPNPRR